MLASRMSADRIPAHPDIAPQRWAGLGIAHQRFGGTGRGEFGSEPSVAPFSIRFATNTAVFGVDSNAAGQTSTSVDQLSSARQTISSPTFCRTFSASAGSS